MSTAYHTIRHAGKVILSFLSHWVRLLWIRLIVMKRLRRKQLIAISLVEHLGDIVACEPIARRVRDLYPDGYILWFVREQYRELIESNPSVDAAFVVHCLTEKRLLIRSSLLDRAVDLHFPERHCALCPTSWIPSATANNSSPVNLSNFYTFGGILRSVSLFAEVPGTDERPRIYIGAGSRAVVDALRLPALCAVLHCASNTIEKDWPCDKWEEVARHLSDAYGYQIVEIGLTSILHASGLASYTNVTGRLSILETAEVIRRGKIFVGIDSGPAHLANAVGTYGVVLLGSYLGFKQYNPFSGRYEDGSNATLLHIDGPVRGISVQSVEHAIDSALNSH